MTAAAVANFAQLEPGFGSEVGILLKHGDCERDFIDDALTAGLRRRPQFKVSGRVVGPVAIDMVDVFSFSKVAPQDFLHDEAVDFDVLPVALDHVVPVGVQAPEAEVFVFPLRVRRVATLSAVLLKGFRGRNFEFDSAAEALPANVSRSSCVGAGARAVHRAFPESPDLIGEKKAVAEKRFSAMSANQLRHRRATLNPSRHDRVPTLFDLKKIVAQGTGSVYFYCGDY